MSDLLIFWALTTLPTIGRALSVVGSMVCVGACFSRLVCEAPDLDASAKAKKSIERLIVVGLIGASIGAVIPDKTGMAIIAGGKLAIEAAKTETGREVGQEVLAAIRGQLKKAAE